VNDYRANARAALQKQAASVEPPKDELEVEMLAMFLCDSGIVTLGPSENGDRLSTGHGWHRTRREEADAYRQQARLALAALTTRRIPEGD